MPKRLFISFMVVFVIVFTTGLLLNGCTKTTTTSQPAQVFNFTLGTMNPTTDLADQSMVAWEKWIERESEGRIKFTHMAAESMAGATDLYDAVRSGIGDIAAQYSAFMAGRYPVNDVLSIPYLLSFPTGNTANVTHMELYEKYPELQAEFTDVKLLFIYYGSTTQLLTVDKQVKTMEDLRGMVLCEIGPWVQKALTLLGGVPENLPPPDIYDALAKGVVDGVEVNLGAAQVFNYTDVIKYITHNSAAQPGYFTVVMNQNKWNSLPPDLQELFSGENALLVSKMFGYQSDQRELADYDKFKVSPDYVFYELTNDERERWKQTCAPLKDEWIQSVTSDIGEEQANAIWEDVLKFAEQYKYSGIDVEMQEIYRDWMVQAGFDPVY
ncbi:MAG: TRAP transporter substrate-binding protein DctP [Dehalococcoidales bacterium]|nr:TRAP transporter substrate-binding protein DctP [Dehalococcoidales bacterium]